MILEYTIDTGLYSLQNTRKETNRDGNANKATSKSDNEQNNEGKNNKKCWKCGQAGHLKSECQSTGNNGDETTQTWGATCVLITKQENVIEESLILDSGATHHICGNRSWMIDIEKLQIPLKINTANGVVNVTEVGKMKILLDNDTRLELQKVLLWDDAPMLLSVGTLIDHSFEVKFCTSGAQIFAPNGQKIMEIKKNDEGVYRIGFTPEVTTCALSAHTINDSRLWHARLNHIAKPRLERILGKQVILPELCTSCCQGKSRRKPVLKHSRNDNREKETLHTLHADLVGPLTESVDRKRGALIICDARSGYLWFEVFRSKSEVPDLLTKVILRLERMFPGAIKFLRTDNGTEFCNRKVYNFLQDRGIQHQTSQAFVHAENGRIENWNRIIFENIRTVLIQGKLSAEYWTYAGKTVVYVHNRLLPTDPSRRSPWEHLFGKAPDLSNIKIFGSPGFAHEEVEKRRKLDKTSIPVIMLGYGQFHEGYYVMDRDHRRIFFTRSFRSDENQLFDLTIRRRDSIMIMMMGMNFH